MNMLTDDNDNAIHNADFFDIDAALKNMESIDLDDPSFYLEQPVFDRRAFNPNIPVNKINSDLANFKNKFTVAHINARSLCNSIEELRHIVYKCKFDAIAITETWLSKNSPKNRFSLNNYTIFRLDRENKRGGGVLWYVRDHYKAKKIKIPPSEAIPEMLWIEVIVGGKKIALGCLYRAPKIPYGVFANLYQPLLSIYTKYDHTILVGDFNSNMLTPEAYETKMLLDSVIEPFSLKQLIQEPTRITHSSRTLIDLIFVTKPQNALFSGVCDAPGISDHCFTYVAYSLKKEKFKPYNVTKRDFKNIDQESFKHDIEFAPWENVLCGGNLNEKVLILENYMNQILDKHAPFKTFRVKKPNHTPWIGKDIKQLMDVRDALKMEFNVTGENTKYEHYKNLRNHVTTVRRLAQKNMFNETINKYPQDSKKFYQAAKKLNIIQNEAVNGSFHFSAEQLNRAFVSNNNAEIDDDLIDEHIRNMYDRNPPCIHKFNFEPVSEREVIKIVKSLKSNSVGVDNLNAFTLKFFIDRIGLVLTHIINLSFEYGIFPDRWKYALIKPIPKVSHPLQETDYRPISLLCTLSKIIEKLAAFQINSYLEKHNLFDPNQSAYKKYFGCNTALLKITDDIMDAIDDSEITLLILLDFSKAFDTINHRLLLEKLSILGFSFEARKWIESYLTDRFQKVIANEDSSTFVHIKNGVPQGSILGPLLFNIFISDMRQYVNFSSCHSYADDTQLKISTKIENINSAISDANKDLQSISNYCRNNALRINADKSYLLICGTKPAMKAVDNLQIGELKINGEIIKRVKSTRNLGLTFDEVLSWRPHINKVIGCAISRFKDLCRYKKFLNFQARKILADALVLSYFNFCDMVFMNMDEYLKKRIQKIQNLCLKFIFDIKKGERWSSTTLRKKIKWLSMNERRTLNGLSLLFKMLKGNAPEYLKDLLTLTSEISEIPTRTYPKNIWIPNHHISSIHRKSFRYEIPRIWNILPENIKNCNTVNTFKKHIKLSLLNDSLRF